MLKQLAIPGACIAAISSLLIAQQPGGPSAEADFEPTVQREEGAVATSVAVEAVRATPAPIKRPVFFGAEVTSVPAELAAHLALSEGDGLLVTNVREGSQAADAGLATWDVIVAIGQEEATEETLEDAASGSRGASLRVVRGGLEQTVAVGTPAEGVVEGPAGSFLSTKSLGADHPFQRVGELDELRANYSQKHQNYSERMRELDAESRQAREDAKQQIERLQKQAEAEVAAYFEPRERAWLELVDQRLAAEHVEALHELGSKWSAVYPEERVIVTEAKLSPVREQVAQLAERVQVVEGTEHDANVLQRAQRRWGSLGKELAGLVHERVERPWSTSLKEVQRHQGRFDEQHRERIQWAVKSNAQIRDQVKERIRCAVRRTQEEFSKQLRRRLAEMQVPEPGEIEACVADVSAQMDSMTNGFIVRVERALAGYRSEMERENGELAAGTEAGLSACDEAFTELAAHVDGVLAAWQPDELAFDGSWQATEHANSQFHRLRGDVRELVNRGRDGTRAGAIQFQEAFQEHRNTSDDAWRDLQKLMGDTQGEAANDCWKLKGPYLDGRFPQEKKKKGKGGEVVRR